MVCIPPKKSYKSFTLKVFYFEKAFAKQGLVQFYRPVLGMTERSICHEKARVLRQDSKKSVVRMML